MRTSIKILVFACALAATAASIEQRKYTDIASYCDKSTTFDEIRTRDVVHTSPAVIFFGKSSGSLLRCLQDDPDKCEFFYQAGSDVTALLINGEYIYAGLNNGQILRCHLNKKSCKTFYFGNSIVFALAGGGDKLFASFYNNTILRCELHQLSCSLLHNMGDIPIALLQVDQYLYIGKDFSVMRCSIDTPNNCTLAIRKDDTVVGLSRKGNSIYVLLVGSLWNCKLGANYEIKDCEHVDYYGKGHIASFNGSWYLYDSSTNPCKLVYNTCNITCESYSNQNQVESMVMAYGTYHMQSRYKNEHTTCLQSPQCQLVTYYNEQQRVALEVHVKDGRLYNSQGFLVDTTDADQGTIVPAAIFVMGPDGRILLSNRHLKGLIHTSSLLAGNPVAGAAEIVVEKGVIKRMLACSEHYKPDLELNKQVIQSLLVQGYTETIESEACCEGAECPLRSQIESNLVELKKMTQIISGLEKSLDNLSRSVSSNIKKNEDLIVFK